MRVYLTSILVDDQRAAEKFYVDVLGFQKKHDIPMGEFAWLTLVGKNDPAGAELLLEPNEHAAGKTFKKAMYDDEIPFAAFQVENVNAEYERLKAAGVQFLKEPMDIGSTRIAVLDDTCGNWIQLVQVDG